MQNMFVVILISEAEHRTGRGKDLMYYGAGSYGV